MWRQREERERGGGGGGAAGKGRVKREVEEGLGGGVLNTQYCNGVLAGFAAEGCAQ